MSQRVEMVGKRFGRLVITGFKPYTFPRGRTQPRYICQCDCGNKTQAFRSNLTSGNVSSCGCFRSEEMRRLHTKHGDTQNGGPHAPEYRVWHGMICRCELRSDKKYADYGGRGITVCKRWRSDYRNFLADMGRRPSPKHSIDRIDNDRGYYPGNCRWATLSEQNLNRRPKRKRKPK
jgi:hypothetical protein